MDTFFIVYMQKTNELRIRHVFCSERMNNFIHLRSEEKNIYLDDGVSPDSDGACRKRHAAVEP